MTIANKICPDMSINLCLKAIKWKTNIYAKRFNVPEIYINITYIEILSIANIIVCWRRYGHLRSVVQEVVSLHFHLWQRAWQKHVVLASMPNKTFKNKHILFQNKLLTKKNRLQTTNKKKIILHKVKRTNERTKRTYFDFVNHK